MEKVYKQFPEDLELSRLRSDFTVKASDLASALTKAAEAQSCDDKWIALLNYISASNIYPMSSLSNDNVAILAKEILDSMNAK